MTDEIKTPKPKKEKALEKVEQEVSTPMQLLAIGTKQGLDVEKMTKLMDLQDRWEANQAKKAFNQSMADFQGECPVIKKTKDGGKTNSGVVAYKYADLATIVEQVREFLQKHGFSYAIKTEFPEGSVKAICIVKHLAGHTEESEVIMPLSTRTNMMSAPQQVAATVTFAKRYAFVNAFGIMTGDDDVDANKSIVETFDVFQYEEKLRAVKNQEELKKVWAGFPLTVKAALENVKNELKEKIQ